MPFNEEIDARVSDRLSGWNTVRKKMFGGTCHLYQGHMMCGVYEDHLILRLGQGPARKALNSPHVKPFDITGRPMTGWVMVSPRGFKGKALNGWLNQARAFVETLPPK